MTLTDPKLSTSEMRKEAESWRRRDKETWIAGRKETGRTVGEREGREKEGMGRESQREGERKGGWKRERECGC